MPSRLPPPGCTTKVAVKNMSPPGDQAISTGLSLPPVMPGSVTGPSGRARAVGGAWEPANCGGEGGSKPGGLGRVRHARRRCFLWRLANSP